MYSCPCFKQCKKLHTQQLYINVFVINRFMHHECGGLKSRLSCTLAVLWVQSTLADSSGVWVSGMSRLLAEQLIRTQRWNGGRLYADNVQDCWRVLHRLIHGFMTNFSAEHHLLSCHHFYPSRFVPSGPFVCISPLFRWSSHPLSANWC